MTYRIELIIEAGDEGRTRMSMQHETFNKARNELIAWIECHTAHVTQGFSVSLRRNEPGDYNGDDLW